MRCDEVAALLDKVQPRASAEGRVDLSADEERLLDRLQKDGYLAPVESADDPRNELAGLRQQLTAVIARRQELVSQLGRLELAAYFAFFGGSDPQLGQLRSQVADATGEEDGLRSRILSLSERASRADASVTVDGRKVMLTVRGKELARNLGPRLARLGPRELGALEEEMGRVRSIFTLRGQKAAEILRIISPQLREFEEIHCRNASVGLAARPEEPGVLGDVLVRTVAALKRYSTWIPWQRLLAAAEVLVTGTPAGTLDDVDDDVAEMGDLWRTVVDRFHPLGDDGLNAALALGAYETSAQHAVMERAGSVVVGFRSLETETAFDLTPAILLVDSGVPVDAGVVERLAWLYRSMRQAGYGRDDSQFAAALLTAAGGIDRQAAYDRFRTAREYLARFSPDPMVIPGAMLASISPSIEETLDNLRLASAEISRNRLSLGGMENLSLGVKLLMGAVLHPLAAPVGRYSGPKPAMAAALPALPFALIGLDTVPLAYYAAMTAFHETALHRLAVTDYSFHPVHTHYVYG